MEYHQVSPDLGSFDSPLQCSQLIIYIQRLLYDVLPRPYPL